MYRNYLTAALRYIAKNKLYSAINVAGLTAGLAACIIITLYVRGELSYDQHWENSDQFTV